MGLRENAKGGRREGGRETEGKKGIRFNKEKSRRKKKR